MLGPVAQLPLRGGVFPPRSLRYRHFQEVRSLHGTRSCLPLGGFPQSPMAAARLSVLRSVR